MCARKTGAVFDNGRKRMNLENVKFDLIETIKKQDELIAKQNDTILSLLNENVEQENFINSIMLEQCAE